MTLTENLSIQKRFLNDSGLRALDYCEKRYQEAGAPTDRWVVINFLERMLQELKSRGGYPPILLAKKKQIQRKEYSIPEPGQAKPSDPLQGYSCTGGWHLPLAGGPAVRCDCQKGAKP